MNKCIFKAITIAIIQSHSAIFGQIQVPNIFWNFNLCGRVWNIVKIWFDICQNIVSASIKIICWWILSIFNIKRNCIFAWQNDWISCDCESNVCAWLKVTINKLCACQSQCCVCFVYHSVCKCSLWQSIVFQICALKQKFSVCFANIDAIESCQNRNAIAEFNFINLSYVFVRSSVITFCKIKFCHINLFLIDDKIVFDFKHCRVCIFWWNSRNLQQIISCQSHLI